MPNSVVTCTVPVAPGRKSRGPARPPSRAGVHTSMGNAACSRGRLAWGSLTPLSRNVKLHLGGYFFLTFQIVPTSVTLKLRRSLWSHRKFHRPDSARPHPRGLCSSYRGRDPLLMFQRPVGCYARLICVRLLGHSCRSGCRPSSDECPPSVARCTSLPRTRLPGTCCS